MLELEELQKATGRSVRADYHLLAAVFGWPPDQLYALQVAPFDELADWADLARRIQAARVK